MPNLLNQMSGHITVILSKVFQMVLYAINIYKYV
jgi:hypothetical protein